MLILKDDRERRRQILQRNRYKHATGQTEKPAFRRLTGVAGRATASPAIEMSRAALVAAVGQGARREGTMVSAHARDCPH